MASHPPTGVPLAADPLWYKDAIIYELHVRAFFDTNADGVGDFRGLAEKLDYLQDLGITAVWLLPFYPSPLKDDGYDIADYTGIHPAYGTLGDFKMFLAEAHKRGLRVITELVLNHTSDQNRWFQLARRPEPGNPWRDFYVWSDTPEKYKDTRIIFKDFEHSNWAWDPVARAYYWHRFYSHQPDLNFDNPQVKSAMFQVLDFWLGMGVDGMRLDAVPYLFEREGTSCENLPETHALLRELRQHVDSRYRDRMLLAEANQWPEDATAYFSAGDAAHMAFHFPLMPRMFMALRMEDRYPIIDILRQTPTLPPAAQWALFLRNHDELTLEMVTDEERDYMYRMYAHDPQARINLGIRRRLAPLLGNNRRRIELMNALLFSLPGTPVLYYGDEIGMGDNIYLGDRNGVRTPMQWSADRNAGFSRANSQRLYLPITIDPDYHYEAVNVESQQKNPSSLLWWMKRLIALRKRYRAFGRGALEFLYPRNRKVLAFVRSHEDERILVVANLSRFVQYVELDMAPYRGTVPVELFGRTEFPRLTEAPFPITLGPHDFYWFHLVPERVEVSTSTAEGIPVVEVASTPDKVLNGEGRRLLEGALPRFLQGHRWFGGKARELKQAELVEAIPFPPGLRGAYLGLVQVTYGEGDPQTYLLPLAVASGAQAARVLEEAPGTVVARLALPRNQEAVLHEPLRERAYASGLLEAIARRRRQNGLRGEVVATCARGSRLGRDPSGVLFEPRIIGAEQSNTSLCYGDQVILKLYRRLEEGLNPELEIGRFLTEKARFPHTPAVAGAIEYRLSGGEAITLGVLQAFVKNEGDAWSYTLDGLGRFLERATGHLGRTAELAQDGRRPLLELAEGQVPPFAHEMIGTYLEAARLLGQRTAELHLALASDSEDPSFAPEPFTNFYQRSIYQSMRNVTEGVFHVLEEKVPGLPEGLREEAQRILGLKEEVLRRFRAIMDRKLTGLRTRVHGDLHLGQVLFTGKDFVFTDFEGEPTRPLSVRRLKRSALRDVAGMLRSFSYAAHAALSATGEGGVVRAEDRPALQVWARLWTVWTSSAYLRSYLKTADEAPFLPRAREELGSLLDIFLLEKAVYELGYELNNRPQWVNLPLQGIRGLLEAPG